MGLRQFTREVRFDQVDRGATGEVSKLLIARGFASNAFSHGDIKLGFRAFHEATGDRREVDFFDLRRRVVHEWPPVPWRVCLAVTAYAASSALVCLLAARSLFIRTTI